MEYKGVELSEEQYTYYKDRDSMGILLPSVAVDGMILSQVDNQIKVLLKELEGEYSLIGSFIEAGKGFEDNLNNIVHKKTGLDVSSDKKIQIKTYGNPDRDSRGHIITTLYAIFTEYEKRPLKDCKWFDVILSEGGDEIRLVNDGEEIILKLSQDFSEWEVEGGLKFKGIEGHGYMISDAFKYFRNTFYDKGDILNIYTKGYTMYEAWKCAESLYGKELSRTNQRRLIGKISLEQRGEGLISKRKQGKVYAQVYRLKTNKELLEDKLRGG